MQAMKSQLQKETTEMKKETTEMKQEATEENAVKQELQAEEPPKKNGSYQWLLLKVAMPALVPKTLQ